MRAAFVCYCSVLLCNETESENYSANVSAARSEFYFLLYNSIRLFPFTLQLSYVEINKNVNTPQYHVHTRHAIVLLVWCSVHRSLRSAHELWSTLGQSRTDAFAIANICALFIYDSFHLLFMYRILYYMNKYTGAGCHSSNQPEKGQKSQAKETWK